ncbi:MAG: hypothetical protein N3G20_02850 [Verrucomicrobiae bacterium]|nr:hypothetical protein [Verrucomicrobiae bacterium]
MRVSTNHDGTVGLQVAVRCYGAARPSGCKIWLIGVTHIGAEDYYAQIQRLLDAQDLVLYEGVGVGQNRFNDFLRDTNQLQRALARVLGLQYQLDALDYAKPHYRNSDLALEDIQRILASQEVSGARAVPSPAGTHEFGLLIQVIEGRGLGGALARFAVGMIGASPRLRALMTVSIIELLGRMPPGVTNAPELPDGMQAIVKVLVEERNKRVIADLGTVLRRRPAPRSVAIIYGAMHMPDLERRLLERVPCKLLGETWLMAFSIDPRQYGISEVELGLARKFVRRQLELLSGDAGAEERQ